MANYRVRPEKSALAEKGFDFETLYQHAHDELSLQQSKRDQIITIFLAIITFLVPFSFSLEGITPVAQGLLFAALAVIGVLFGIIVVRYRIYKECYWLACQTLTQLANHAPKSIDKNLVQHLFYHSLRKKYSKFANPKERKILKGRLVKKNLFSSETLYFAAHTFVVGILSGLSVVFLLGLAWWVVAIAVAVGALIILLLFATYFNGLAQLIETLKYPDDASGEEAIKADKAFNVAFSKAWFLHFYLDEEN